VYLLLKILDRLKQDTQLLQKDCTAGCISLG